MTLKNPNLVLWLIRIGVFLLGFVFEWVAFMASIFFVSLASLLSASIPLLSLFVLLAGVMFFCMALIPIVGVDIITSTFDSTKWSKDTEH